MGFGKPKYGGSGGKATWSIQDGDNIIRVLPPMHSLADEGRWAVYETMHWGYSGVDPKDSSKTKARPFRCIRVEDRRTGLVTQECPECSLIEQHKAQEKEKESELRAAKKSEEEVEAGLEPIRAWLKAHRPDAKWYLAVKKGDEFGQFKIPHRLKKAMEEIITRVRNEDGIDALELDQGLVFNVKRTGDGFVVPDTIELVMEDVTINGRKLKQIKVDPISEEQAAKALERIEDLSKAGGIRLTFEQILQLTESSGDPEEVDQIIGRKAGEASPQSKASAPANKPPANDNGTSKPAGAAASTTKPAMDPAVAERLKALQARQAAEKAAAEAKAERKAAQDAAPAQETHAAEALALSDEEFLAKFGDASA